MGWIKSQTITENGGSPEKNRAFEGVFDGNGFFVKNAILYAENNYFGLFSYIGKNGVVKNLNIDSTNRLTAHNNVRKIAALAGINLGTIENCTNSAVSDLPPQT